MGTRNFSRYVVTHGWTISETTSRLLLLAVSNAPRSLTRQGVRFCRMLLQRQRRTWFACQRAAKCRGRRRRTTRSNGRRCISREGVYGSCPLFGRENCMSAFAAEFPGCGQAVYRSAGKNGERFCVPTPGRFPSLANALALTPRPHRRVRITYA